MRRIECLFHQAEHQRRHAQPLQAEQDLLKQLGVSGGELRLVDMAQRIFLSKAGITKMMDRLEASGLVERVRSTSDRQLLALKESLQSLLEGHGRWEGQMKHLAGRGC